MSKLVLLEHQARCRRSYAVLFAVVALLSVLCVLPTAPAGAASDETPDNTFAVSLNANGEYASEEGTVEYGPLSISDDGRYVAFESPSGNLGAHGPAETVEGYVKDLHTGAVALASRADGTEGAPAGEGGIENFELSGDGRYVLFTSTASGLVSGLPEEEEFERHVYRRDLWTGETTLVDRVSGPNGAILSRGAWGEGISGNGRYVVFTAEASDLEEPAATHARTPSQTTVYLRDMQTGTTTAVSRANGAGGQIADETSEALSVSPEGRYVAFATLANNLGDGEGQVYLRDLQAHTTTLVSGNALGDPGDRRSGAPTLIGAQGCQVEFDSIAYDLLEPLPLEISGEQVYLANLCVSPARMTLVSQSEGAIAGDASGTFGGSADGHLLLFSGFFTGPGSYNLFLRNLESEQTIQLDRASSSTGQLANEPVQLAAISANGCRVVFGSQATNLVANPPVPSEERVPSEIYARQLAPCNEEPSASPGSIDLGAQPMDTLGAAHRITVTAGSEALPIRRMKLTGEGASDFIVDDDECTGEALQPDESCTVSVRFVPSTTGGRTATLLVDSPAEPALEVLLRGEGDLLPAGERGFQGDAGTPGATGTQGPAGPAGPRGSAGAKGAQGAKGPRGRAGASSRATCRVRARTRKIVCEVLYRGKRALPATLATIVSGSRRYAHGTLKGLRESRKPVKGHRYTLLVRLDGRILRLRVILR